jgi:HEAT repeats
MDAVSFYIATARNGDVDGAFHGLRELGADALPALQTVYRGENDPIIRSLIIRAAWEPRRPSVIDFLTKALRDPAPMVWREALDGLVALSSAESFRALQTAADQVDEPERRAWIEEAIEQAAGAIDSRP